MTGLIPGTSEMERVDPDWTPPIPIHSRAFGADVAQAQGALAGSLTGALEDWARRKERLDSETPDAEAGAPEPEAAVAAARAAEQDLLNQAHQVGTGMWTYDLENAGAAGAALDVASAPRDGFGRKRGRDAVTGFERHRKHLDGVFTLTMRKAPDARARRAIEGPLRRWHAQAMARDS